MTAVRTDLYKPQAALAAEMLRGWILGPTLRALRHETLQTLMGGFPAVHGRTSFHYLREKRANALAGGLRGATLVANSATKNFIRSERNPPLNVIRKKTFGKCQADGNWGKVRSLL